MAIAPSYPVLTGLNTKAAAESIAKPRRLADCLEAAEQFEIQIAAERIYVPVRATYNIDHERQDGTERIEFQIKRIHSRLCPFVNADRPFLYIRLRHED